MEDKYTKKKFSSRYEYGKYRRTSEYIAARKAWIREWANTYTCYFCKRSFLALEELKSHIFDAHLYELGALLEEFRGRKW